MILPQVASSRHGETEHERLMPRRQWTEPTKKRTFATFPRGRPLNQAIPTYALYGEHDEHLGADWLHCETILARSRLHDFEIRPHRHEQFYQILFLETGEGLVTIDGREALLEAPCLLLLPPLVVHGFSFSHNVEGLVVTLFERRLAEILRASPDVIRGLEAPRLLGLAEELPVARRIAAILAAVWDEFRAQQPARLAAIEAQLVLVLIAAHRLAVQAGEAAVEGQVRGQAHIVRFRQLVEQDFRRRLPIETYAGRLGLTATHLNRLCRTHLGASALDVVNARIMLEAKRCLVFTSLGVKETAGALGFEDPAYFTRFFRRESGLTPLAFRARQRGG